MQLFHHPARIARELHAVIACETMALLILFWIRGRYVSIVLCSAVKIVGN